MENITVIYKSEITHDGTPWVIAIALECGMVQQGKTKQDAKERLVKCLKHMRNLALEKGETPFATLTPWPLYEVVSLTQP